MFYRSYLAEPMPSSFYLLLWTCGALSLVQKPTEAYLVADRFNIFLYLFPILLEAKLFIHGRLPTALDHSIIRWAHEICHREPLLFRLCYYSMLNTFVKIIAPSLNKSIKNRVTQLPNTVYHIYRISYACYLKKIANVDHQSFRVGFHGYPPSILEKL